MYSSITVLMYHAVSADGVPLAGADPHYAVSRGQFARHLEQAQATGAAPTSVARMLSGSGSAQHVAFTFDDGHASNAWAAEALARAGAAADFFVNPSAVGGANCLSWQALRDMASAGMSIQSHGQHHRYLNELSDDDVMAELRDSKHAIEDKLGQAVTLFAPPGGRVSSNLPAQAAHAGYTAVCSSRVGLWQLGTSRWDIPRVAVLQSTSDEQLQKWLTQDRIEMLRLQARYRLLRAGKRLLGNGGYERLRGALLRRSS
jgi:peptidoglycan/xylan/chitin deacetylase (PgdA/CDA1 family)